MRLGAMPNVPIIHLISGYSVEESPSATNPLAWSPRGALSKFISTALTERSSASMRSRDGIGSTSMASATSSTKLLIAPYPIGAPADGLRAGVPNLSSSIWAVFEQYSGRTMTFSPAEPMDWISSAVGRHPGMQFTSTPIGDRRSRSSFAPASQPGSAMPYPRRFTPSFSPPWMSADLRSAHIAVSYPSANPIPERSASSITGSLPSTPVNPE